MLTFTNQNGDTGYILFYGHRNPSVHLQGTRKNVGQGVLHLRNPNPLEGVMTQLINVGDPQLMYELRQNARNTRAVFTNQQNLKITYNHQVTIQGYDNVLQLTLYYLENPPTVVRESRILDDYQLWRARR